MSRMCLFSILTLFLAAGLGACIPSKSESEKEKQPQPVPATVQQAEVLENPQPKREPEPGKSNLSVSLDGSANGAISLTEMARLAEERRNDPDADRKRMEEVTLRQGGVMVYPSDDGKGYTVRGGHGLTGKIIPNDLGVGWVFEGLFEQKVEGLQVGDINSGDVTDGLPFQGLELNNMPGLKMIMIPVVLPDINAIETGETYVTPFRFDITAGPETQFVVNIMPVKSL